MVHSIFHPGPIVALCIILTVTVSTILCSKDLLHPLQSSFGLLQLGWFLIVVVTLLSAFLSSVHAGAGALPLRWRPQREADEDQLQYCQACDGFKGPRAHHCHTCGQCSLKMDHHCPWINSCVGYQNQGSFLLFVTSVPVGTIQATFIQFLYLWKHWDDLHRAPFFTIVLFGIGLSFGVTVAVSTMAFMQIQNVIRNKTELEGWIETKAKSRRKYTTLEPYTHPYDVGIGRNISVFLQQVFSSTFDGLYGWPLAPGCNELTLPQEQIAQKRDKWAKSKLMTIATEPARWSIAYGIRVCLCAPIPSLDHRLDVHQGDVVRVFSESHGWCYGEICQSQDTLKLRSLTWDEAVAQSKLCHTTAPTDKQRLARGGNVGDAIGGIDQLAQSRAAAKKKKKPKRGWFPSVCVASTKSE
eukprot:m.112215 g.112215  ORF g.112215 m.112215 type:complete len:412 (+) comp17031_c1_seq13:256-1491(+)